MTGVEFENLKNKGLSHEARSLYIFYLREAYILGPLIINIADISYNISCYSGVIPFNPTPDMCIALIKELEQFGFIKRVNPKHANDYQGVTITLPYIESQKQELPSMPFIMYQGWRPGPSYLHAAQMAGLSDPNFSEQDLQGFISYWASKAEMRNQIAWERAFVQRLVRRRAAEKKGFAAPTINNNNFTDMPSGGFTRPRESNKVRKF